MPKTLEEMPAGALSYWKLQQTHPEYDAAYWARCRAFYKGGKALLEHRLLMERCLPRHFGGLENDEIYLQRVATAHYVNHAGTLLNHMLAKLFQSPVTVDIEGDPLPEDFYSDVKRDGLRRSPFSQFLKQAMLETLICRHTWVLVDLPRPEVVPRTLAEQEQMGALRPYLVRIDAESVLDWKHDLDGSLEWVLLKFVSNERETVFDSRNVVQEDYWLYTRTEWKHWQIRYKLSDRSKHDSTPVPPDTPVSLVEEGVHSFAGNVPFVRIEVPEGLWAMNKLESIVREHFNKRNALSWAEHKTLLPVPTAFIDPGDLGDGTSGFDGHDKATEGNRATTQQRSPVNIVQLNAPPGGGDRFEWIGPPSDSFAVCAESVRQSRDEIFRVVNEMHMAADVEGQAIRRSGDSKKEDVKPLEAVLREYGQIVRDAAAQILFLASAGIGRPTQYLVQGVDEYETDSKGSEVEIATALDLIEMPSATFKKLHKMDFARSILADVAQKDDLEAIQKELESYYTQDNEELRYDLTPEDEANEQNEAEEENSEDLG